MTLCYKMKLQGKGLFLHALEQSEIICFFK